MKENDDVMEEESRQTAKTKTLKQAIKKNKIIVPSGRNMADPFLNQSIAFPLEGRDKPDWLDTSLCAGSAM
eukprot:CAMPEP_0202454490 /NCGR_PEP_ID=MMETSP1360-20130828/12209_1 /ASSEMBLY_ACC=CAM_ASM_000848 /TAXON_ID=515479 /ORGANISM="Licmophora paradoxa, Strain CCMP2313" /LENGTH=70 /DNA_ID=CAMNT_0049073817 /DNA_START=107 /DNA_END=316 /DNA_ORIENTATION=-